MGLQDHLQPPRPERPKRTSVISGRHRATHDGRMASSTRNDHASPGDRGAATADGSWMAWTAIGIVGIWIAVVLITLFAPDFVSGSTGAHAARRVHDVVLASSARSSSCERSASSAGRRRGEPLGSGCRSSRLPVVETGSDPKRIAFGAFFAPVPAAMLIALAGVVTNVFRRGPVQG